MSIFANNETFFSHGRMGVFYEIFLKNLNWIDGEKKKSLDEKKEHQPLSNILLFVY